MIVGPGEKEQVLHRDIGIWPFIQKMGKAAPEVMVSILLALSDFTEEVGATRVIPGSHLWDDFSQTPQTGRYRGGGDAGRQRHYFISEKPSMVPAPTSRRAHGVTGCT